MRFRSRRDCPGAVQDDSTPENSEKWEDFLRATLFDILGAWKENSGKDWLDELRREPSRHVETRDATRDSGPLNF